MAVENKQQKPKKKLPFLWKVVIAAAIATILGMFALGGLGFLTYAREVFFWGGSFTFLTGVGTTIGEVIGSNVIKNRKAKRTESERTQDIERVPFQENSQEYSYATDRSSNNRENEIRSR